MSVPARIDLLDRVAWSLVCLFVFSIPWEKSIQVPGTGTLSHLVGILAFAAGAALAVRRRSIRPFNLAMGFAALFVLWAALTFFWSLDRDATIMRATTFAELLAMLWLIWDECRSRDRQVRLMQSYVSGAVLASASANATWPAAGSRRFRRRTIPQAGRKFLTLVNTDRSAPFPR